MSFGRRRPRVIRRTGEIRRRVGQVVLLRLGLYSPRADWTARRAELKKQDQQSITCHLPPGGTVPVKTNNPPVRAIAQRDYFALAKSGSTLAGTGQN